MKIEIDEIESILAKKKLAKPLIDSIIEELQQAAIEEKEEKETAPKGDKKKWGFVGIAITDDTNKAKIISETPLFLISIKEGDDHNLIINNLTKASQEYSLNTRKGRKFPIKNMADLFGNLKPKFLKQFGCKIKTKEPIIIITNKNELN